MAMKKCKSTLGFFDFFFKDLSLNSHIVQLETESSIRFHLRQRARRSNIFNSVHTSSGAMGTKMNFNGLGHTSTNPPTLTMWKRHGPVYLPGVSCSGSGNTSVQMLLAVLIT